MGICWTQGDLEDNITLVPRNSEGLWLGMRQLREAHLNSGYDDATIVKMIVKKVAAYRPDVIIVGNLHGSTWALELFPELQTLGTIVIGYMHDCYLVTGRCAYPGSCSLYQMGCDESCPTAEEYPALAPNKIAVAWHLRREIFGGDTGIPLAANSTWTLDMARRSLQDMRFGQVVCYGLDERLFKPIDRSLARRLLGIPQESFVILGGAVNVNDPRKGGHIFKEVMAALSERAQFLIFGDESGGMQGVYGTGLQRDYRKMPLLYSAADLFVGTSMEEAFGQTLCEASACGIPIVAFRVGGIPEIAQDGRNARLVDEIGALPLLKEIESFMADPEKREAFGQAGRSLVEKEFTLARQAERWQQYLSAVAEL
jgi:glycosyltransferase involved in cell wall biosynthesis